MLARSLSGWPRANALEPSRIVGEVPQLCMGILLKNECSARSDGDPGWKPTSWSTVKNIHESLTAVSKRLARISGPVLALAATLLLSGCGGGGGGSNPPPSGGVSISINPTSATLTAGATQQFTATVTGSTNTAVTWSVSSVVGGNSTVGTITPSGFYTAPPSNHVGGAFNVAVAAVSQADATKSASAGVTVNPPSSGNLSSLNPIVIMQNSQGFTLTVNGVNFTSSSQVLLNGVAKTTALVNSTQLTAQISMSDIASPGTFSVSVQTGGQSVGTLNFFVVPAIHPQSVSVAAGGSADASIDIPTLASPTLSFFAIGTCGSTSCTGGETGVQVSRGGSATLFVVGSDNVGDGFFPGTFFSVTGASGDVTVTQPLAAMFGPTTRGFPSARFNITVSTSAVPGPRSIIATDPAGEISVFPGGLEIIP